MKVKNMIWKTWMLWFMFFFSAELTAADAETEIRVNVTIVAAMCVINDNQQIVVDFGDDVMTTRVDGLYKLKLLNYKVSCPGGNNNMKMQIRGDSATFGYGLLATNKTNLGVQFFKDFSIFPVNEWVSFNYPNLPILGTVLVKRYNSQLSGGAFSAGATLRVEYQ